MNAHKNIGIKLVSKHVGKGEEGDWKYDKWVCTLQLDGREITFDFNTGIGHKGKAPGLSMVLETLFMDGLSFENSMGFEDFCSDFGYETDSRKAEGIYKACGELGKKLKYLFNVTDLAEKQEELQGIGLIN